MDAWLIWLIIAVVVGGAEILTLTAVLGLLGGAALLTAGAAALGLGLVPQLLVFATTAVAGLVVVRPIAVRHMQRPQTERFGIEALIGRAAEVTQEVTGRTGTVRIGDELWTARALDDSVAIPPGATVHVFHIDGATAVVYPQE